MRALIVTPQFPLPDCSGGHTRIGNLVREMGRCHEVHMLSLITPEQAGYEGRLEGLARPATTLCVRYNHSLGARIGEALLPSRWTRTAGRIRDRLSGLPALVARVNFPRYTVLLAEMLRREAFDVIQLEYTEMGRFLPLIRRLAPTARVVLEEIDISYLAHRRLDESTDRHKPRGLKTEIRRIEAFERRLWRACDAVVTMSEVDRRHIEEAVGPGVAWTVPNGVDTDYFAFRPSTEPVPRVMFLGYFLHPPNVVGLKFFCDEVWPLVRRRHPNAELEVIGGDPPPELRRLDGVEGIRIRGFVPDVRPYMERCAAMAVPIRCGGGTRLKVLEAFAAGLSVVSTPLGCEGIEVVDGKHALLAESPEDLAAALCALLTDRSRARALAENARRLVETQYSWQAIGRELDAVWHGDPARGAAPAQRVEPAEVSGHA